MSARDQHGGAPPREPDEPKPDHEAAADFLERFRPEGPWVLTAIHPATKKINTLTVGTREGVVAFCDGHRDRNLYFSVNPTIGRMEKKAARADIAALEWLHVDIDPRAREDVEGEQARIVGILTDQVPEGVPAPTVVVFSGGGYQGFWKLADPFEIGGDLERAEEAKLWNRQLELIFGGDNCHDVSRIMRLPGTVNWPDQYKIEKGRVPALASVVAEATDWERVYDLSRFERAPAECSGQRGSVPAVVNAAEVPRLAGVDALDEWDVSDDMKLIVTHGRHPEPQPHQAEFSRSEWLFYVVCELSRRGVPAEVVCSVITDEQFGISESVRDKPNSARYAERQVARARELLQEFDRPGQNGEGPPKANYANARRAIVRLGIMCEHDLFRDRMIVGGHALQQYQGDLSDNACSMLRQLILERFGFDPRKDHTRDAVRQLCIENVYDPVCDYLDRLEWDGQPRLEQWLSTYLGSDDTEYVHAVGRILLIAAVRRARHPGTKFDTIVVLEGPQGVGKSEAVVTLAGGPEYFSDEAILGLSSREVAEAVEGVWFYELGELDNMSKADVQKVKAFCTRTHDRARKAYAHFKDHQPRRCVFIATTNEDAYLRDVTGNRRFLPVATNRIDLEKLKRDRDQLLAEAAAREAEGELIVLPKELWDEAAAEQRRREEIDPWQDKLESVKGEVVGDEERIFSRTLFDEVLQLSADRQYASVGRRVAGLMRRIGWTGPENVTINGNRRKGFRRPRGHARAELEVPAEDLPF